ncbi:MAG: phosphatidate cytidylyltransferase [Ilumatobacteraceae bacterium]
MSDDMWGDSGSLFDGPDRRKSDDESTSEDRPTTPTFSFDDESGPLPHWTEAPSGGISRADESAEDTEERAPVRSFDDDDLGILDDDVPTGRSEDDLWATFTAEQPVWQPGDSPEPTRESPAVGTFDEPADSVGSSTSQQSRIVIGTDPSGMDRPMSESQAAVREDSGGTRRRAAGKSKASAPRPGAPASSGRDLPVATAVGILLVAIFVGTLVYRPWAALVLVAVVLGLAAVEFYDKVTEKGYRPAVVPGIVACVIAPIAAYWQGDGALPLVIVFAFIATAGTYIGARSVDIGPLPNVSITTLPIVWVGLAGAYAGLILRFSTTGEVLRADNGTDTLFMLALAVVANDVGALFVGAAAGRTPLRSWISPGKTVEGFIGGALLTIVVLIVAGIGGWNTTWDSTGDLLLLAIVVSIFAPMGDLVESMFKRNLGVKDFGSLVKGHGGVLDRFDGFLLTLPIVYYLTLILEPWAG